MDEGAIDRGTRRVLEGTEPDVQAVLDSFPQYVLIVDSDHHVVMANKNLYDSFGMTPEEVIGIYCPKAIHGIDTPYPGCPVEEAYETGASVERELYDNTTDRWMMSAAYVTDMVTPQGRPLYLHVVQDITEKKKAEEALSHLRTSLEDTVALRTRELESANKELHREVLERRRAENKIRQLAYFDTLTGLPNRANFSNLLTQEMESAALHGTKLGVALLDLDGFKTVNDTTGHDAGDSMLRVVGARLKEATRAGDIAARMGGDEFLFIITSITEADELKTITQRLLDVFIEPFALGAKQFKITASIGIAMYPDDGADEVALMRHADLAMYRAKNAGGNRFCRHGADTC